MLIIVCHTYKLMISNYLSLLFKNLNRTFREWGLPLVLFLGFGFAILLLAAHKLASFPHGGWYFGLFCLILLQGVQVSKKEIDFLQTLSNKYPYKLLLARNFLLAIPLSIVLFCYSFYLPLICFLGYVVIFSFFPTTLSVRYHLKSPFPKAAHEFHTHFRKNLLGIVICYLILGIAVTVGNQNLAIAVLFFLFLSYIGVYASAEPRSYLLLYPSPSRLLNEKMKDLAKSHLIFFLPPSVILLAFFPQSTIFILQSNLYLLFGMYGLLFVKYFKYPDSFLLQFWQSFFLLLFTPSLFYFEYFILVVFSLFYLYKKAQNNLNTIVCWK